MLRTRKTRIDPMKVLSGYLLLLTATSVFAESAFERELTQISAQHDQSLAVAIDPIERRYKEAMTSLLRRATQANDLDTAIKIRQAIGETSGTTVIPATAKVELTKHGLEKELERTTWLANTPEWLMKMTFLKGKVIHNPNQKGEGRSAPFHAIDGSTIVYQWDAGEQITITFSSDLSTCKRQRTTYHKGE